MTKASNLPGGGAAVPSLVPTTGRQGMGGTAAIAFAGVPLAVAPTLDRSGRLSELRQEFEARLAHLKVPGACWAGLPIDPKHIALVLAQNDGPRNLRFPFYDAEPRFDRWRTGRQAVEHGEANLAIMGRWIICAIEETRSAPDRESLHRLLGIVEAWLLFPDRYADVAGTEAGVRARPGGAARGRQQRADAEQQTAALRADYKLAMNISPEGDAARDALGVGTRIILEAERTRSDAIIAALAKRGGVLPRTMRDRIKPQRTRHAR